MSIPFVDKIENEYGEDKILVIREFDRADEYADEEYAARNTVGTAVDIFSLDDSCGLNEPTGLDPSGDAFAVTQTVAILD